MSRRFARTAAAAERVAGLDATWRSLLFGDDGAVKDPTEPSQALLVTTDALLDGLRAHAVTIPERARRHWLEETLGIAALPALPDEVVAVAKAEPAAVPAVLRAGTELRAAKAEGVPERTYLTTDTLTVLGATFAGVHGYVASGLDDWAHFSADVAAPFPPFKGHVAEHRIDFVTDAITFTGGGGATVTLTFTGSNVASLVGSRARWYHSTKDGLAAAAATVSGNVVKLTLSDDCAPYDLDGEKVAFLRVAIPGSRMTAARYALRFTRVDVTLRRDRIQPDGAYYNDGALDVTKEMKPFGPVPRRGDAWYVHSDEAFSRDLKAIWVDVTLAKTGKSGDSGGAGGGGGAATPETTLTLTDLINAVVDLVLESYGVTSTHRAALRDSLATPVTNAVTGAVGGSPTLDKVYDAGSAIADAVLDIAGLGELDRAATATYDTLHTAWRAAPVILRGPEPDKPPTRNEIKAWVRAEVTRFVAERTPDIVDLGAGVATGGGDKKPKGPTLTWERRSSATWDAIGTAQSDLDLSKKGAIPASRRTEVAGTEGHFVRLRIAQGDFGWDAYLEGIAKFAAAAATQGGKPDAKDLEPPEPPVVESVFISYTTDSTPVRDIRARNEPAVRRLVDGAEHVPFWQPVSGAGGRAGAVTFGFGIAEGMLGQTFAWYAHVAQAPACASAGRTHRAEWQYWSTDGAWVDVDTLDGTRGLRQSGLVRFVTPRDWAEGCDDVGANAGRWLRLCTQTPDFVGDLLAVHPDAMTARYRAPGTPDDTAPLTPLVPEQLKGLRTPIPGVKVTNPLPGTPGRAMESVERYRDRAGSVVRHRNRAIQAWDYETLVTTEFPEVAVARCLPHTDADDCSVAGSVGIVVLPRSTERKPYPSVALADRIAAALKPRIPVHATVVVLCPEYKEIRFRADVVLRRGVAAADARTRILDAVERRLHPLSGTEGAPFGQSLYPSSLLAFLESLADVDHVTAFALVLPSPLKGDYVDVDACRGLIASAGDHELNLTEQL